MKKNFFTLFLVFVTLTIWFIVFYRIFSREEKVVISSKTEHRQKMVKKDSLILNYRDPFRVKKVVIASKKVAIKEAIITPSFTFKGVIKSKKGVFLMINDTLICPRDKIGIYTVTKIYNDSIKVRKGTQTHTIKRI